MQPAPKKSLSGPNSRNNRPARQRLTHRLAHLIHQAQVAPGSLTPENILTLHTALGNQQLQGLLQGAHLNMPPLPIPGQQMGPAMQGQAQIDGQAQGGVQAQNQQLDIGEDDLTALLNELNQGVGDTPALHDDDWEYILNGTPSAQASGGANTSVNQGGIALVEAGDSAFAQLGGEFTELEVDPGLGYCTAIVVWGDDWCAMAHLPGGDPGQLGDGGNDIYNIAQEPTVTGVFLIIGVSNAQSIIDYAHAVNNGLMLMNGNIDVCPGTAMDLKLNANGQYSMSGGLPDEKLQKILKPQFLAKLQNDPTYWDDFPFFKAWAEQNGWFNEKR